MNKIRMMGAPTDVGASRRGASMGPAALRVAELQRSLQQHGLEVIDGGDLGGPANPQQPRQAPRQMHMVGLGQMGAFRLPVPHRRQTPALAVVSHAAHEHSEQMSLP